MKRVTLYNNFYCPLHLMNANIQNIIDFDSSNASLGEKAFMQFALKQPEVYKVTTEEAITICDSEGSNRACRCDFKIEFTNGLIRYVEFNGSHHFFGRTNMKLHNFQTMQYNFTKKQMQMLKDQQYVLNINMLISLNDESGWADPIKKDLYLNVVNTYIYEEKFKLAFQYLQNPKLNKHINYNISLKDLIILRSSKIKFADNYMQSLISFHSYKQIVDPAIV